LGRLIYSAIMSLDGFVADEAGHFEWAEPDEEVHSFINQLERDVGIYLYGRRLYEVMAAWEAMSLEGQPPYMKDFAQVWRGAQKIVYSRSLETVSTERTRIEREFDPRAIRQLKSSSGGDLIVGGPELASHAFEARLVDECPLFIAPVTVGRGKPALPANARYRFELRDHRRFESGMVYLRYRAVPDN
jgi:dihydrofolate reductase